MQMIYAEQSFQNSLLQLMRIYDIRPSAKLEIQFIELQIIVGIVIGDIKNYPRKTIAFWND